MIETTKSRPISTRRTFRDAWIDALNAALAEVTGIRFPDVYWWEKPLEFWELILGVKPWGRQREVILACRDYDRVAVKSGRRVSKSHTVGGLALTYYSAFEDARVLLTSTTSRQVDGILWLELTKMLARAGRCVACKRADPEGRRIARPCPHSALIRGEPGRLARTGLKMNPIDPTDFREVWGFTASETEAVQGFAGSKMLTIADESSGIPATIFDALDGNRAGGGRQVLFGNPTRTSGEFYDAFHEKALDPDDPKSTGYFGITISSRESPNVVEGRVVVPGLATREWIAEREREWGVDSPLFRVHVDGEFAVNEDGKIFSVDVIASAEARWDTAPEAGRLFLGLDPAGETGMGDESALAPRRGLKAFPILTARGLDAEGHLAWLLDVCKVRRIGREVPVVVMDRDGSVGARIYGFLNGFLDSLPEDAPPPFELYGLRGADKPSREADRYDRQRDATTASLAAWIRDGGAIPEDPKLAKEMHVVEWRQLVNGKMKVTAKDEIRKELGRSPDRYDALSLSTWEPYALSAEDDLPRPGAASDAGTGRDEADDDALDPYAPSIIDPYGGR